MSNHTTSTLLGLQGCFLFYIKQYCIKGYTSFFFSRQNKLVQLLGIKQDPYSQTTNINVRLLYTYILLFILT
jgi:hypothetical protein